MMNKKLDKLNTYLCGSAVGMCLEYMYRVECTPIAIVIVSLLIVSIVIDVLK